MPFSASTSPPVATRPQASGSSGSIQSERRSERWVVKIGGSIGSTPEAAVADVVELFAAGRSVVVVHGGGAEADQVAAELGRPVRYLTAPGGRRSRYTDAAAMDALCLGILGRLKPSLVTRLVAAGVPAVGLTGIDGGLVTARRTPPARVTLDGRPCVVRDDRSGRVEQVDPRLVGVLLDAGYVPVISPPAFDAAGGQAVNVDADRVATDLAVALAADWLVLLSDVPGLLADRDRPDSLVTEVDCDSPDAALGLAAGRMQVKVRSCVRARRAGVARVVLGDGRGPSPVRAARDGAGTRFVLEGDR